MGISINGGIQNGWFRMETPIHMNDLELLLFQETHIYIYIYIHMFTHHCNLASANLITMIMITIVILLIIILSSFGKSPIWYKI